MTGNRAPRVFGPMVGWRVTRWLLLYVAMILLDAAMVIATMSTL
jgi:hypothetical protein